MISASNLRKLTICTLLGTLTCACLFGCETPATQPAAPGGTTVDTGVKKPTTNDNGTSVVSEKPAMNPAYTGGTGSKVK